MSPLRFILRSLTHHWRLNVTVALGVAAGVAVLTGALVVGDSVRGSLRDMALSRLGRVSHLVAPGRFFRQQLSSETSHNGQVGTEAPWLSGAIFLQATLHHPQQQRQASGVNVYGVLPEFWTFGEGRPQQSPGDDEVVLNRVAAEALGAEVGDEVVIRLPRPSEIPSDSPLGRKTELVRSFRAVVREVLPGRGLASFSVRPNQVQPPTAFFSLAALQRTLDQPDRINALLMTAAPPAPLPLKLADYGLELAEVRRPQGSYWNLTSESMLLPPAVVQAAQKAWANHRPQAALTYLANAIAAKDREIPYSTITGIQSTAELGPLLDDQGQPIVLRDNELVLNSWAAEQLAAQEGDTLRVTYFLPETTHGQVEEATAEFVLKAVVPLSPLGEPPTLANDPALTPELRGVTDQLTIADWDPPFPFDSSRVREADEVYWSDHRATPKAFVSLAAARRLWGSRFGDTTSIRIPADGLAREVLAGRLLQEVPPAAMGFAVQPVRQQALAAAQGTTPFSVLFLGFSFFIIAAAVMLVGLLFRLGIEQRAGQLGILTAVGLPPARVGRMLLGEGITVALVGGLLGVVIGGAYAWLMLAGLQTWWLAAIRSRFLQLHVLPGSLALGYAGGVLVSVLTMAAALRRLRQMSVRRLLTNQAGEAASLVRGRPRLSRWVLTLALLGAVALAALAVRQSDLAQAGAFFGSGSMMLVAGLVAVWIRLRYGGEGAAPWRRRAVLLRLALRNAGRNPARSTLSIALIAAASFLIVALSAFQIDPSQHVPRDDSGNGGFSLYAQTDHPLHFNPGLAEGRLELGFADDEQAVVAEAAIFPLRVQPGDDASCLNLYQSQRPRILGLPPALRRRGGFAWSDTAAATAAQRENPWLLLEQDLGRDAQGRPIVPVVLDAATAQYSLHLAGIGSTYTVQDAGGNPVTLQVVGLLRNSLLQGDLLTSEAHLLRLYPAVSGYRVLLVDSRSRPDAPRYRAWQHLAAEHFDDTQQAILTAAVQGTPPDATQRRAIEASIRPAALAAAQRVVSQLVSQSAAAADDPRRLAAVWLAARVAEVRRLDAAALGRLLANPAEVDARILEQRLSDYGLDAVATGQRLAEFSAVQNTYISTFQSLGGLGLLLGTFGLAVVQWRNVLERRGELALLRAVGFRRRRLARMVVLENAVLLLLGLLVGVLAASIAVLPHWLTQQAAVPWRWLAVTLAAVLVVGIGTGRWAAWAMLRVRLLAALRGD